VFDDERAKTQAMTSGCCRRGQWGENNASVDSNAQTFRGVDRALKE
jgi:hypothetical protein